MLVVTRPNICLLSDMRNATEILFPIIPPRFRTDEDVDVFNVLQWTSSVELSEYCLLSDMRNVRTHHSPQVSD